MNIIYHSAFDFKTKNSLDSTGTLDNRLALLEKNGSVYFMQYTQFRVEGESLLFRKHNILADRMYFLEVANSTLSDKERRRRFFSILGKRRFGANDNPCDLYTTKKHPDLYALMETLESVKNDGSSEPVRYERTDRNPNRYEVWFITHDKQPYAVMHQENIASRKRFAKTFIIDLRKKDILRLENIKHNAFTVEYLFHRIGEFYFKSVVEEKSLPLRLSQIGDDGGA